MKLSFKIHRGTLEIGGSCVEVCTEGTRILIDFGAPLVEADGGSFELSAYEGLSQEELVQKGVLPNIDGLYEEGGGSVDGVILSHAHPDHYGLMNYIDGAVPFYLSEATHRLIELSNLFTPQEVHLKEVRYFEKEKPFNIGDITITPYWADHSAFDAYSFLIEADGKRIFYSGDIRGHGRKSKVFQRFLHQAPQNVDHLLLEGTKLSEGNAFPKSEAEIEEEFVELFQAGDQIDLIHCSGQNIDRLVSIYRACKRSGKTMVADVYVAKVLMEMAAFARLPYPSENFEQLRVLFPYYTSRCLKREGHEEKLYRFKHYKVTKEEISAQPERFAMIVRPSMQKDLEHISGIEGGNSIFSMWAGYLEKGRTKEFLDYLKSRNFHFHQLHTSGHADPSTLKALADGMDPKRIVPIHTFERDRYKDFFDQPVMEVEDEEWVDT